MANVLDNLAADLYKAADLVGRELVGFIPASTINAGSERVAKGDLIRAAFTREVTAGDIVESMTIPEGTDQTVDNKTMTISKARYVQIPYTGEEQKHLNNGVGFQTVYGDQVKQAMRTICNEIETDMAVAAYQGSSRAFGTAGTTPFGSNFNEVANLRKILVDNGMPVDDGQVSLVLNTAAGVKLRNLASLQQVNTAGNDSLLRQGELLNLQGMSIKESHQIQAHTAGTGTGYLLNDASSAVKDSVIATDTGTGTILAGDIVTFAGDADNKYVVNSDLSGGSFTIGTPGLQVALADDAAITVGGDYTANIAMHRNAMELAIRAPAVPQSGDAAIDSLVIADDRSGLQFEVRVYSGYRKTMIEVAAAWGVKVWKPDMVATLLG